MSLPVSSRVYLRGDSNGEDNGAGGGADGGGGRAADEAVMRAKAALSKLSLEDDEDWRLPLSFNKPRHTATIEGVSCISQTWRLKERVRVCVFMYYFPSPRLLLLSLQVHARKMMRYCCGRVCTAPLASCLCAHIYIHICLLYTYAPKHAEVYIYV